MFPCDAWGPVPEISVSSLDPTALAATWDPLRNVRPEWSTLRRPLLLEALAAGVGRVSFGTMEGGRSIFSYRVEQTRSWRLAWLLHDSEPRPLEAAALPRAIVSGGEIRVVTRLLDGAGVGLCGHPTAQVEVPPSLAIATVGFSSPGADPQDPGAIANGVLRVSAVAESPAAKLHLAVDAAATDLDLAVLSPMAITSIRAEPAAPSTDALDSLRGFVYLGTRVAWNAGGGQGRPPAWIVRLRAFAGDDEVGGATFLVENPSPGSATFLGPDGTAGDRIETREPVVGLVPPAGAAGRIPLRVSAPGSSAAPLELTVDVPAAPTF